MSDKREAESIFRTVVLPAVVAATVAVPGSCYTWRLEIARWEKETAYSARKELFQKRTELIERTVTLFSQIPKAAGLKAGADYSMCEGAKASPTKRPTPEAANAALQNIAAMQDMQAQLAAVLTLDVIYFGPQTEKAVKSLRAKLEATKPWWTVPTADLQAFVNSLSRELFTDPKWPEQKEAS